MQDTPDMDILRSMVYPVITPATVAEYRATDEKFTFVIDLCQTTATAYDNHWGVQRAVDFVEDILAGDRLLRLPR
tara:strand:+ start:988 stop:1212 length:225 start_codon:yes stop_codon:yes gene_type:complete